MTLRILATGGTFDKHYNELNGTLGFSDSHLVVKGAGYSSGMSYEPSTIATLRRALDEQRRGGR